MSHLLHYDFMTFLTSNVMTVHSTWVRFFKVPDWPLVVFLRVANLAFNLKKINSLAVVVRLAAFCSFFYTTCFLKGANVFFCSFF